MAEPLLKMRYRREMKKIRHLQKLITDPVLLETLGVLMKNAKRLSNVASTNASNAAQKGFQKAKTGVKTVGDTSEALVAALVESGEAARIREMFENRVPESVSVWTSDQFDSLRKSGMLEMAANRALDALK